MKKTTIFENIGWSEYANAEIKIIEYFTPSNDYEYCEVVIDGKRTAESFATAEAIRMALGEEVGDWILDQM